jgi:glutathione S-transferase
VPDITLWGFDASTYVRTVKMLLAEKGVTEFKQVPLDVLKGEPRSEEHRQRHPFGKVPVLDYDGTRVLETAAITRFLNDKLPGVSLIPASAEDRARMDMVIGVIDSYGYGALLGGVVAYHLFPDFVGGTPAGPRNGPQGHRVRYEDSRQFALHRGGTESGGPLFRSHHRIRCDDIRQGRRV